MGAARQAALDLVNLVGSLEDAVDGWKAQAVAADATISKMSAEIAAKTAEIARLNGLIELPVASTIVGSSAQPGSLAAFDALEGQVGKLGAWRLYIATKTPASADVEKIRVCLAGGRRPFASVAGGTDVAQATASARDFVSRVGPLGGAGSITFGHEPTQKFTDPALYVKAKNAFYTVVRELLPTWDTLDIFMLYDIEQGGPRHPDRWIADLALLDGFGVDAYDHGKHTPAEMLEPALALADAYKRPLYVCETGTVEDATRPSYKADWITAFAAMAKADPRIGGWIWFSSGVGPNAPSYGWYVTTSPASTAAFKAAVADQ